MEEDDVYKNEGEYFLPREPVEQAVARKKERAKTLEVQSALKEVVAHLEEKILFYGSVDSIPTAVKAEPEKFLIMHNANELVRNTLLEEKFYIEGLLDNTGQAGVM